MILDRFRIKVLDEFNFALYETRAKKPKSGVVKEGEIEVLIGYYGTLGSALNSMSQQHFKSLDDSSVAEDVLGAVKALEIALNDKYGKLTASKFNKGEEL